MKLKCASGADYNTAFANLSGAVMFTSDDQSSDDVNGETSDSNGHMTPSASIEHVLTVKWLCAVVWLDVEVDTSVIDGYFDTVCSCSLAATAQKDAQSRYDVLPAPYLPTCLPCDHQWHAKCRSVSTTKYLPRQTPRYERANRRARYDNGLDLCARWLTFLLTDMSAYRAQVDSSAKTIREQVQAGFMVRSAVDKNLVEAFNKYACPCSTRCPSVAHAVVVTTWRHTHACLCSYEYRYQQFSAVGGGTCSGLAVGIWSFVTCSLQHNFLTVPPCAQHITL